MSAHIVRLPSYLFSPRTPMAEVAIRLGWPPCTVCGSAPSDPKHQLHLNAMRLRWLFTLARDSEQRKLWRRVDRWEKRDR